MVRIFDSTVLFSKSSRGGLRPPTHDILSSDGCMHASKIPGLRHPDSPFSQIKDKMVLSSLEELRE